MLIIDKKSIKEYLICRIAMKELKGCNKIYSSKIRCMPRITIEAQVSFLINLVVSEFLSESVFKY